MLANLNLISRKAVVNVAKTNSLWEQEEKTFRETRFKGKPFLIWVPQYLKSLNQGNGVSQQIFSQEQAQPGLTLQGLIHINIHIRWAIVLAEKETNINICNTFNGDVWLWMAKRHSYSITAADSCIPNTIPKPRHYLLDRHLRKDIRK